MEKAVVLLSGGMDSAVTLYIAKQQYDCSVIIFDYNQRCRKEIDCAKHLCEINNISFHFLNISLPWKGSSLLDKNVDIPKALDNTKEIPNTYVPARNIIFLSFALSFAETLKAKAIFIGAHQLDFSNYPDCRSEFFESFQNVIKTGTKVGQGSNKIDIITPIINKTKREIVKIGFDLFVPFEYTWSCYTSLDEPCGVCESCLFRIQAFEQLGQKDPLLK